MRILRFRRARILGIGLVAIAVSAAAVTEAMGAHLAERVYERYEELGSSWVLAQNPLVERENPFLRQVEAASVRVAAHPDVVETMAFRGATNVQVGDVLSNLDLILLGPTYDLATHPYVFILYDSESDRTSFLMNDLTLVEGAWPTQDGEIALEEGWARAHGLSVGTVAPLRNDPFGFGKDPLGTFTVTALFDRASRGEFAESQDLVIAAPSPAITAVFERNGWDGVTFPTAVLMARVDLRDPMGGIDAVRSVLLDAGFDAALHQPAWMAEGGEAAPGATGAYEAGEKPRVTVYANHGLIEDSLAAARRSAGWYRILDLSAVGMAAFGTAFVTAADVHRERREVALRQSLGFSPLRLWLRALTRSAGAGALGGLVGALVAIAASKTGLAASFLGVALLVDTPRMLVLGVVGGALLYALSALPVHLRIIRADPSVNLGRVRG